MTDKEKYVAQRLLESWFPNGGLESLKNQNPENYESWVEVAHQDAAVAVKAVEEYQQ